MEIDKTTFESFVSAAKSSMTNIYDKIKPALDDTIRNTEMYILGPVGIKAVDAPDAPDVLVTVVKEYICLTAFLKELRKLDVVLTSTGFGVVSNNTTAPASKSRVDALEMSLRLSRERARGKMLCLLCNVEGWGVQNVAVTLIATPLFAFHMFEERASREVSLKEWADSQPIINEALEMVGDAISHKQLQDIMIKVRTGILQSPAYAYVVKLINDFIFLKLWNSPMLRRKLENIIRTIEDDPETFRIYPTSEEYKARHYEHTDCNKGPAYFFK